MPKVFYKVIIILALLLQFVIVHAKDALQIDAYIESDYMRVTFYVDPTTYFEPVLQGNKIIIAFDKEFKPNFARVLAEEDTVIENARSDGKNIVFTLNDRKVVSKIRQFITDKSLGIDLVFQADNSKKDLVVDRIIELSPIPELKPIIPKYLPKLKPKLPVKKITSDPIVQKKVTESKVKKSKEDLKIQDLTQVSKPNVNKKLEVQKPIKPKTQDDHKVQENDKEEQNQKLDNKQGNNTPKPTVKAEKKDLHVKKTKKIEEKIKKVEEKISPSHIKPDVQVKDNIIKVIFPSTKDIGAAVFRRGETTWIIFDKYIKVDTQHLLDHFDEEDTVIEQYQDKDHTIMMIHNEAITHHVVLKENGNWVVTMSDEPILKRRYETTLKIADHPFSPELLLVNDQPSEIFKLQDSKIGDELIIATFKNNGFLFKNSVHYVDFDILPTAQGAVILPYADGVKATKIENGFSLYMPSQIAQYESTEEEMSNLLFIPATDSYFNFQGREELNEDITFHELLHKYYRGIIFSPPAQRNLKRMELADFLFAHGFMYEARGLLKNIEQSDTIYDKNKLMMMQGAIAWVNNDYELARRLIDKVESERDNERKHLEHKFWQSLIKTSQLPETLSDMNYNANKDSLLLHYPQFLQHAFAIKSIESELMHDERLDSAEITLDDLEGVPINNRGYLLYLEGILAQKRGELLKSAKIWQKLSHDVLDRKNRVLASIALVRQQRYLNKMTVKEAINILDPLTIVWKNDPIEIELLEYLGELLLEDKQLINALNTWKAATQSNAFSSRQLKLTSRMSQLFTEIFLNEDKEFISDLKAIALYYDYRELTPIGKKGEQVIDTLIKRLINIDLLDRAAELMEHQIQYRKKGVDRENVITRLAEIYLMDNKADNAMKTLSMKKYAQISPEDIRKRYFLQVLSLLELERMPQALALLKNDLSDDAQDLKRHIYWKYHFWPDLIQLLEPKVDIIKEAAYSNKALDKQELEMLLRLAVAYNMNNQSTKIPVIFNEKFLKSIAKHKDVVSAIQFLASSNKIHPMHLDQTINVANIESYVKYYKEKFAKKTDK